MPSSGVPANCISVEQLLLRQVAVRAGGFYRFMAAFRVDLFHDAVQMILYGEFGEIQFAGNFLVRQAPGN